MRNRRRLLKYLLIIGVLCLQMDMLRAQDTNNVKLPPSPRVEKGQQPVHADHDAFGFPEKHRDTVQAAALKPPSARTDTTAKKKIPDKVPVANKTSAAGDRLHENRQSPMPEARADTEARKNTAVTASMKVVIHTFSTPGFTKYSFDNYRGLVNYLLANNAVFQNTFRYWPDEMTPLRRDDSATKITTGLFYTVLGVLFLLAILRLSFTKYFSDLFKAFFNPTLSRRQLREQLSQTPVPALLLNIFFTVSAGLYVFLILMHFNYITVTSPLKLIPLFILIFMIIYIVKFLFLRFSGWLFGYGELASGYIFTLYMVNKILGIMLLPFILILAFCSPQIATVALNISLVLIILMFVYRYIRILGLARNKIIFNKFHFFLYLCGFEIAPVLIIGKLVLIWLNGA